MSHRRLALIIHASALVAAQACSGEPAGDGGEPDSSSTLPDGAAPDVTADVANAPDGGGDSGFVPPVCDPPPVAQTCADFPPGELADFLYCRYYVPGPYTPPGYYTEMIGPKGPGQWFAPCSASLGETQSRANQYANSKGAPSNDFEIESSATSQYFFEALIRFDNATASGDPWYVTYRNTRCDYFEGTVLKGAPFASADPLRTLASYLWYVDSARMSGSHVLAGFPSVAGTTATVSLCHTTMTFGDWGLCDEIEVLQTDYTLDLATGTLSMGEPQVALSFSGKCH